MAITLKWKKPLPFKAPKEWIKPKWAYAQLVRSTGLVEDLCKHGIGHPNKVWVEGKDEHWKVHGCDGCCHE